MTTSTSPAAAPRYAWYGRVSTEDEQDPTLSFPRQLANAERQVAESGGRIVAHYYDIESGTGTYAARGSGGLVGFEIAIPRDGGLRDLLADATRRPARFDRVIVESISRLSRNSSVAFRVEDELRTASVRLCAADEPLEESFGTIVLRHVNIGIARGYHHELMVKSRQGQETSTRQGWHTGGVALYGYRFAIHDHPNPHKANRGQSKRTLELDPVRANVVRSVYDWYLSGGVGLTQIRDRLNTEPDRYPSPVPVDSARATGVWSRSSVWEVLRNPKYTGYQVWNRRARKQGHNRTNPPEAWIWSDQPAHPAIITRDEYEAVQVRAGANQRSRQAVTATQTRPTARADYLYRGLLRCAICGLRMWGNHRRNSRYYSCQPSHQRAKNIPASHPAHVYLNEARLHHTLIPFLADALLGAERVDYWRRCLDAAAKPDRPARGRRARRGDPGRDRRPRTAAQPATAQPRSRRPHPLPSPPDRRTRRRTRRRHRRTSPGSRYRRRTSGHTAAHVGRHRPPARTPTHPGRSARRRPPAATAGVVRPASARPRLPAWRPSHRRKPHPLRRPGPGPLRKANCGGLVRAPGRIRTYAPGSGGRCSIP